MKKFLLVALVSLLTSYSFGQTWKQGNALDGTDAGTYSIYNSVSGNVVQLSPDYGYLFGDQHNNNFFRANTDCNCPEFRMSNGFSLFFLQSLTHKVEWTIQNKDMTVAGLDDLPNMFSRSLSGDSTILSYSLSVPTGYTISIVQSTDPAKGKVTNSSVTSGGTLTVYFESIATGTSNVQLAIFLR